MRNPYSFQDKPPGFISGRLPSIYQSKEINDVSQIIETLSPQTAAALKPQTAILPSPATHIVDQSKYVNFSTIPLNIGVVSTLILPHPVTQRLFLFIINNHPVNQMIINFGNNAAVGFGITIAASLGFVGFDTVVPQNDVYIIGSGAGTNGCLIYANSELG